MLYNGPMRHSEQANAMRETLQYLVTSDIPGEHKRVLIGAVTQALRLQETEDRRVETMQGPGADWQLHETKMLEEFLQGKVARGWQHADEVLMRLARQLHRTPADVRLKAIELGFGIGVDYRIAKQNAVATEEE